MKTNLFFTLILSFFTLQASAESCKEKYENYLEKNSYAENLENFTVRALYPVGRDDNSTLKDLSLTGGGISGAVTIGMFIGGVGAVSLIPTAAAVGTYASYVGVTTAITQAPVRKMLRLINQAEDFSQGQIENPGKLLRKIIKAAREVNPDLEAVDVAHSILEASESGRLCTNRKFFRKLKKQARLGLFKI